jgi:hypothetical protein
MMAVVPELRYSRSERLCDVINNKLGMAQETPSNCYIVEVDLQFLRPRDVIDIVICSLLVRTWWGPKYNTMHRIRFLSLNKTYLLVIWRLQPIWGLGLLLRGSLILYLWTIGRTPWMSDQPVARPLPTQDNTNTE